MLKVKCIDNGNSGEKLENNKIYNVEENEKFYIIDDCWWVKSRFELVEDTKPQTNLKNNTTILKLINKYGEKQLDIAQEELAELIQAISKYKRIGSDAERQMVVEELVDVKIMLEQIEITLDIKEYEIDYFTKKKLDRMEERMQLEEKSLFMGNFDSLIELGIETLVMDINKHNARIGRK